MEGLIHYQKHGPGREKERNPIPFSSPNHYCYLPMEASWQGIVDNIVHKSRPFMADNEASKVENWSNKVKEKATRKPVLSEFFANPVP